jgi:hypothetical protein
MAAGKGGVERSGVTVVVPTTARAIRILGLRWSQRIPSSRVVLGNETSDQCEGWTKDYNSLLRPGDPMRMLLGLPEGGGCRLVVSDEIDHGRSWIVPVAAAHFADARAQAVHADMPRARMMIWGTGAIDFSQPETPEAARIVENDYHLTSKIDLSREHFAAAAHDGAPLLCLLPAGPDAERAATVLRKVVGQQPHHIEIVKSLADVIRPIDSFLRTGKFDAPPDMKYAPVPYTPPPEAAEEEPAPAPPPPKTSAPPRGGSRPDVSPRPLAGDAPPIHGVETPPLTAATPPASKPVGALSVGVLGGIAASLIAVIGVGAMMLRDPPTPPPAPQPVRPVPTPVPQPPRPAVVTIPPQPQPGQSALAPIVPQVTIPAVAPQPFNPSSSAPSAPPVPTVTVPAVAPPSPTPPVIPPPAPGQQAAVAPTAAPAAAPDAGTPVGRLTILSPPAGSSCQAQVLEMNPRFVETVVELASGQPVLEIEGSGLCGLAIAGSGGAQARFAQGTVAGTVPSLSSGGRIVFNPSNTSGRLPDIAVSGGAIDKIELRRR